MVIECEIEKEYRICEMCHCIFPEDCFKESCQPNTIHITECPYCEDKDHWVKVEVTLKRIKQ